MGEYFIVGIVIILAIFVGIYLGKSLSKSQLSSATSSLEERNKLLQAQLGQQQEEIGNLKTELETKRTEKENVQNELIRRETEFENLRQKNEEQKAEVEKLQEKFTKEFENLANKILDQKSEKFTLQNKENIKNILDPLQEKIKTFEEKVEKNSLASVDRHAKLGKYLELLQEQNIKISEEANNLTKALKADTKMQGGWGEVILDTVLEKSGLVKDREYFKQKAYEDSEGNKVLPDVVIHLPNDKKMVIDSKVSMRAYERYINEEDEKLKEVHLKNHIKALKNHIIQLSDKKYEDLHKSESPDFILMFIPIDPALYLAQNNDNSFFFTAFQKKILLVSPTTLLATLRTIDTLWSNEKQQQNALEIAKHAASLYHKFKILLDDLNIVGNRLKSTTSAYQDSMKKLTGNQNLIKDIHKLEELGISPKKKIAQNWLQRASKNQEEN